MVTCPICKSEAEEIEGDAFDGAWFRCLKHREFGVSDTALKARKNAKPEHGNAPLKKRLSEPAQKSARKFSTSIFELAITNAMSALPPKADINRSTGTSTKGQKRTDGGYRTGPLRLPDYIGNSILWRYEHDLVFGDEEFERFDLRDLLSH